MYHTVNIHSMCQKHIDEANLKSIGLKTQILEDLAHSIDAYLTACKEEMSKEKFESLSKFAFEQYGYSLIKIMRN